MDQGTDTAVVPTQSEKGRSRPSRRRIGFAAGAVLLALGFWILTPGAVASDASAVFGGEYRPGEWFHVGEPGMASSDLTVLWARPRVVGDADVEVRVCRRRGTGGGDTIGTARGDVLNDFCADTPRLGRGTRLVAEGRGGSNPHYIVVSLLPRTADGLVAYCGLDIAYRSGIRFGFARGAGTMHAIVHPKGSLPFVDAFGEPSAVPEPEDDPCRGGNAAEQ